MGGGGGAVCDPDPVPLASTVCLLVHLQAAAMSSRGGKKKSTKTSRSAKAGVIFPVGRMLRYIKKGHPKYRIGVGAPVYMAAVLEYLTGEYARAPGDTAVLTSRRSGHLLETDPTRALAFLWKLFKPAQKLHQSYDEHFLPGAPVVNILPRWLFIPPPWLCMCVCIGMHIYTFVLGCSVHVEIALIVPIMGDNYSFFGILS